MALAENKNKETTHFSTLTFGQITEHIAFVKVIYNGDVIYDDLYGAETPQSVRRLMANYSAKIIYEMNIEVVQSHHCILTIKGER